MTDATWTDDTSLEMAMSALRRLMQAGDLYRTKVANHFNLGWSELQALGHLVGAGELGQTELASRLDITTGAATALVDRLERAGLAKRHPHPHDRRRSIVRLTDQAFTLITASREWTRHAFDGLEDDRLDDVVILLNLLSDRLAAQAVELDNVLVTLQPAE